ncbi:DNA mismatch repair protein, C-terminal domain-containing protein [Toxoplasma gondii p89]|uniref:DNA mismatch repair protein, C-terminal domain-containing protein n=1 Tax=Toxoplasma gondii p89 TaxID=943119 RepID=A0A086JE73_TOXGO|nr:DNA mismatch repair protein, C-terminal domain-containing protein [Toxoplasma gondii p89]
MPFLSAQVDWRKETSCLRDAAEAFARFFASVPPHVTAAADASSLAVHPAVRDIFSMHFLPAIRGYWKCALPKTYFSDGTIRVVASLPALYRVFERC